MPVPLSLVWFIAAALTVILILQYVVAPVIIYFTQTAIERPDWHQTELSQLDPVMVQYLGQIALGFHEHGFVVVKNLYIPGAVPGVQGFQALLVNRATNDLAVIIMSRGSHVRPALTFSIRSEFSDGTRLTTGAYPPPNIFPSDPAADWQNFPWVTQPAVLCEAHRRRLVATKRDRYTRTIFMPGHEQAYFDRDWDRSNQWAVQCGYRYLDEQAGLYRFTVKGAFLATWKLVAPIKQVRIWLRSRAARRAWNALGMNDYRPSGVMPTNTSPTAN